MRALVVLLLLVIAGTGAATVVRFPAFALVDERAHFAYAVEVADFGRLPWLGRARISPEIEALDEGVYPAPPRVDPRTRGLAGFSYEAFQPPLFYALAAPVTRLAGEDLRVRLRALRALGLLLLLATAAVLWRLAARVAGPGAAIGVGALALCVLALPGVVVRTVTVSNAGLELLLGAVAALALWEARARGSGRWLVAAGAVVGLGLLTRTTFVVFVPVLLWVARGLPRRPALLALALPVLLLAPWIASNLDRYGAPTASAVVREMQEPFLNPTGERYGLEAMRERAGRLLNGGLAEEWWSEFLPTWKRRLRDVVMAVLFLGPVVLALRRRDRLPPGAWLLVVPLLLALPLMAAGLLVGNWDFFYPRYLHAALPGFAVWAALAVPPRARPWAAGVFLLGLVGLWARLATVTPFTA